MSTPDIRVKLSPEGVQEVLAALKTVQNQADRSNRAAGSGLNSIQTIARNLKTLLPAIGLAGLTAGLAAMAKQALNTADAIGKMAAKVGATAEGVSVLQFAAKTADVSNEQLGTGLTKLAIKLGALQAGSKSAAADFRRLGLTAKDFAGKDTVQAFDLISQRLGKLENSTLKTELTVQIFGKTGAELIPLLNDLAEQGFGSVEAAARQLGLVIDDETAGTAQAVNDSFTIMKAQAQGLALQFVAGLAPSILDVMSSFREETAGKGVDSMKEFGAETGRILRVVIAFFRLFFDAVSGIFSALGDQVGGFAATLGALTSGNFRQAANIWRAMGEQGRGDYENFKAKFVKDWQRVVDEANKTVKPLSATRPRGRGTAPAGEDEAAARAAAAERAKEERDLARLAQERQRAEETAGKTRFDLEQRLLELTGQQRDAKIRALDEELAKQREILAASAGGVTAVDEQRFGRIRQAEVARIDFQDAFDKANQELENLSIARERIQQDVELGLATEKDAQIQLAQIEIARLPIMQQLAAAALTAAQASGDPALIAQAQSLNVQLGQVAVSVDRGSEALARFKEGATQAASSELTNFLAEGITSAESFGDAMASLADGVIKSLQRIAAEIIAQQIISGLTSMFGGGPASGLSEVAITAVRMKSGGVVRRAGGGTVDGSGGGQLSGPGTGTSDSIPALTATGRTVLLSSGEFIVRESVVRRPGMLELLHQLNGGLPRFSPPSSRMRYAQGGVVDGGAAAAGGMIVNQNFHITAPGGSIDRSSQQQVAAAAARGLAQASRRNN